MKNRVDFTTFYFDKVGAYFLQTMLVCLCLYFVSFCLILFLVCIVFGQMKCCGQNIVIIIPYFYQSMQKHNEWLSNRGYIQHIKVLTKIHNRRIQTSSKTLLVTKQQPKTSHQRYSHNIHNKNQHCDDSPTFARSKEAKPKDNLTIRQQQILWDNYYLGKRIIETPPVISKRRQDEDYRKHKRLVQCLTASNTRKVLPTQFRVKKLQEYKQNMEQLGEGKAIQAATQKYFICLEIKGLTFYRQKPFLDGLLLILTHHTKDGRHKRQNSESFPASEMLDKHFYFSIPKRLLNSQEPLTVQIQNFKGLEQLSVGYFSFPAKVQNTFKPQLFHCGKLIGQLEISLNGGKLLDSNYKTVL